MKIDDLILEHWEQLCSQATPAPWRRSNGGLGVLSDAFEASGWVCQVSRVTPINDAAFIACAREAMPALIEEVRRLKKRQDELLATIVKITNETPFPDEVRDAVAQRGKLLAEIGTLRAELAELHAKR